MTSPCPIAALAPALAAAIKEHDRLDEACFGVHGADYDNALKAQLDAYGRVLTFESAIAQLVPTSATGAATLALVLNARLDVARSDLTRERQAEMARMVASLLTYLEGGGAAIDPFLRQMYGLTSAPPPAETLPAWIAAAH